MPLTANQIRQKLGQFRAVDKANLPNKRSLQPSEQVRDPVAQARKQAFQITSPQLGNTKKPSSFFVLKTYVVSLYNIPHGVRDQTSAASSRGSSGTAPTELAPWDNQATRAFMHVGLVGNGTGMFSDDQAPHTSVMRAYEFMDTEIDDGVNISRSGQICNVVFPTDDTTVCVVDSWTQDDDESGNEQPILLRSYYAAGRSTYPVGGAASARTLRRRRRRPGGSGTPTPPTPPVPPTPAPTPTPPPGGSSGAPERNPPNTCPDLSSYPKSGPSRSKWRSKLMGMTLTSTYDATKHPTDKEVAHFFEVMPTGGKQNPGRGEWGTGAWGPKWQNNKPPGLARTTRPCSSQRSGLRIMDYYVNQLHGTEIDPEHHWITKLLVTSLFYGESAFILNVLPWQFDIRTKGDKRFCKDSHDSNVPGNYHQRIGAIEDGPRGASDSITCSLGFHGANFGAWNDWMKTLGRSPYHITKQSLKDEIQIAYIYYYKYILQPLLSQPGVSIDQATSEILINLMTTQHAGPVFFSQLSRATGAFSVIKKSGGTREVKPRTGLAGLSGLTCDGPSATKCGPALNKVINKYADYVVSRDPSRNKKKVKEGKYKSYWKRINELRNILRDSAKQGSSWGGDVYVRLRHTRYSPAGTKTGIDTLVDGKRYVILKPAK